MIVKNFPNIFHKTYLDMSKSIIKKIYSDRLSQFTALQVFSSKGECHDALPSQRLRVTLNKYIQGGLGGSKG